MSLAATCKVSIAFADGPLVVSPTWTDVTAYVRSVRTNRGRNNELDDFQAGTATVVLENVDRRFDPDYSSGAYYPNVKVRRQIKIEGVYSAVTYPIFRGVVQSWGQDWPVHNRDATCMVQAVDLFGILATWDLPNTAGEMYALSLSPSAWLPLDDSDNVARDRVSGYFGNYPSDRESVDALEPLGDGASQFGPGALIVNGSWGSSTDSTVAFLVKDPVDGGVDLVNVASSAGFLFAETSGGGVRGVFNIPPDTAEVTGGNVLGTTSHVVLVRSGTTVTLYVNGVSIGSDTDGALTAAFVPTSVTVNDLNSTITATSFDEVMVFHGTALTATQAGLLADAELTGWASQTADARITRVLDLLDVPSGLYSTAAASSSVGVFQAGSDALSYLQTVARSDQGRLFVNRSGVITFHPKTTDMGASAAATFADDGTASSVRYSGFGLEHDDRLIYNDVTVTGVESEATSANATSQGTYSIRSLSVRTALPLNSACRDVAQAYVARFADPQTRGKGWTVHPERALNGSATLGYATVLGRELGDVVSLKRTPPVGSTITKSVSVTSIGHDIDIPEGRWQVNFAGAPAYTTASFRWGTSNWDGADTWS